MRRLLAPSVVVLLLLVAADGLRAQEVRVESLKFKGNKQVSSGKLEKAIETEANPWYRFFLPWKKSKIFDEDVFLTDLLRIERFYQQEGYLLSKVANYELVYNKKHDEVNIIVHIDEGEPTRVDAVTLQFKADSARGLIPERLAREMKLKRGKRYREQDLKLDYDKIIERFSNNGYPYIEARVRPTFDHAQHLVNLEWLLKPGPYSRFGKIRYTGNQHVSANAIRRGLGFSTGQPFAQKKLSLAQSQVYRLELFQFVSLKATNLESKPKDIPIEVHVKEAKLRTLKFGLGFGTEESFRGFAQWRHRNFLGGARILRINAKRSTKLLPLEIETELSQPYFLSNRNDLIFKPFFKKRDERSFNERSIGAELTLNRRLTRETNVFLSTIIEKDTVETAGVGSNKSKSILRLGLSHNSSNDIFAPSSGTISSLLVEEAGQFINTPSKYIKISGQHRFYKRFKNKNVFAFKLSMGIMQAIRGSSATPQEDRFFSGGNYSVRGWGRQELGPALTDSTGSTPLGGNSLIEGSFELRRSLFKQFAGAMFLDYGNVWSKWDQFDFLDLRYAIGFGLRYNTLIGPIRIDFGWKLNKQPQDRRRAQVHFSIGQAF